MRIVINLEVHDTGAFDVQIRTPGRYSIYSTLETLRDVRPDGSFLEGLKANRAISDRYSQIQMVFHV